MDTSHYQIIDANINRVSEGLRVIEDYARFISKNKTVTVQLAQLRRQINTSEKNHINHLLIRDTSQDMRAFEAPPPRENTFVLLKANCKRVEEGLRVLEEYTGNPLYNKARYVMYQVEKEILLTSLKKSITPGVYLISDTIEILEQGLLWKVSCIQLRDKTSAKKDILKKAITLAKKARTARIPFIVNDHVDIAMFSDADGVHLGQDDVDTPTVRKLLGPHKIIGRSTHTLSEGLQAQKEGADYVGIGPIWATHSKPEEKAIGTSYLQRAKKELTIPYIAIGGVNLQNLSQLIALGVSHIAVISAYKDIPQMQKLFKKSLQLT